MLMSELRCKEEHRILFIFLGISFTEIIKFTEWKWSIDASNECYNFSANVVLKKNKKYNLLDDGRLRKIL